MMEKLEHEQLDQDLANTKDIDKNSVPTYLGAHL